MTSLLQPVTDTHSAQQTQSCVIHPAQLCAAQTADIHTEHLICIYFAYTCCECNMIVFISKAGYIEKKLTYSVTIYCVNQDTSEYTCNSLPFF